MKLLLSGEGPTDMGAIRPMADGPEFTPGPMALLVDRLINVQLGYSPLSLLKYDSNAVRFVSKQDLAAMKNQAPTLLPGVKQLKGQGHFMRNAVLLGLRAQEFAQETQDSVVAILFRDSDGTHSSPRDDWQQKVESIRKGFGRVKFASGVAMVPRPKSEAWMICALKPQPYQHCDALEDASGNDDSPNSLKRQLAALFGDVEQNSDIQAEFVREGRVDPLRLNMHSFAAFRQNLEQVLGEL